LEERRRRQTERRPGLTNRIPRRSQPTNATPTASSQVISLSSGEEEEKPVRSHGVTPHSHPRNPTSGSTPVDSVKSRQRSTPQDVISINSDSDDGENYQAVSSRSAARQKQFKTPAAPTSRALSGDTGKKNASQTPE